MPRFALAVLVTLGCLSVTGAKNCKTHKTFKDFDEKELTKFITKIPKADLHVHLDGSLRLSTLIELAKQYNVTLPAYTEEGLLQLVFKPKYANLNEYLQGFAYTGAVLLKPGALRRVAYEFAVDEFSEGVHYVDCRFAPQLDVTTLDASALVGAIREVAIGLEEAKQVFNSRDDVRNGKMPPYDYGIIVIAMRFWLGVFSPYFQALSDATKYATEVERLQLGALVAAQAAVVAREEYNLPVTGFDIAGAENGYPGINYAAAYQYAVDHFIYSTVHAGEDAGPKNIYDAVTKLNAERIGHGFNLFNYQLDMNETGRSEADSKRFVDDLVTLVGNERTAFEVCLTSNLQTEASLNGDIRNHPFKDMIKAELKVTLNTDNRLVSNTNTVREILLAIQNFDISPRRLKEIVISGFERGFRPGTYKAKKAYIKQVTKRYEAVEREFGLCRHC